MDILFITNYARGLFARLATSGWRPYVGWGGGYLCYQLIYFAAVTVPRDNLAVDPQFYWFILGVVSLYVSTFFGRGIEKYMERAQQSPTGGLVNNNAINATQAPA